MRLRVLIEILLVAVLVAPFAVTTGYARIETVDVSPSVLVVGEPITFFGTVSGSSLDDQIGVFVHSDSNCRSNSVIASTYVLAGNATYTIANSTVGIYNVTLAFPVTSSSGWMVQLGYQTGLPAGPYSVGVQDVVIGTGLCRNFTVANQGVPEFPEQAVTFFLTLLVALSIVTAKKRHVVRQILPTTTM